MLMLKLSIWSGCSVDTKVDQNMPLVKIVSLPSYAVLEDSYSFSWTNVNLKKEKAQLIWHGRIGIFSIFLTSNSYCLVPIEIRSV